ncbi:MAG TPA: class I SAM-dependent methyltransferase [Chloroflexi bacterium]|nr:class I SAM-dependent methyltransferase [Chloroflexota bacterium]
MDESIKRTVQQQFGDHASDYVTSAIHAGGYSLGRLLELTDPQPGWRVLDVATGGGHTALAFAPRVQQVVAADITRDMLQAARDHLHRQGAGNVTFCQADAEALPFPPGAFHCVTCRLAAHHFPNVIAFIRESVRVLSAGGLLAVSDNVVSGEAKVARFVNLFEKLRDPSHSWAYTLEDWVSFFSSAGLEVVHREVVRKEMDFDGWAARMGVTGDTLTRLRVLLVQAPDEARRWLRPRHVGDRLVFSIAEGIIVGRR